MQKLAFPRNKIERLNKIRKTMHIFNHIQSGPKLLLKYQTDKHKSNQRQEDVIRNQVTTFQRTKR